MYLTELSIRRPAVSWVLSLIGIIPNLLAAIFVLGLMGLINLPLDMMTITIAAITIGIAVDNSIHYIYRFREEFEKLKDYEKTVFVEEALHRLVEVYYRLGLIEEAKQAAAILGYNYQSGEWYKKSYKVFNKKYKPKKIAKDKETSLIRRKIKGLFN